MIPFIQLCIHTSIYQFLHSSIYPSIHTLGHLSLHSYIPPFTYLIGNHPSLMYSAITQFIHLSIPSSIHPYKINRPTMYPSLLPSNHLSIYLYIRITIGDPTIRRWGLWHFCARNLAYTLHNSAQSAILYNNYKTQDIISHLRGCSHNFNLQTYN